MAADDTYRDFFFLQRRQKALRQLDKIDAPNMSTMFNIVKARGAEDKREAELLLKTALDSKDPAIMEESLVGLENIKVKTPKLYQDYIGQLSETLKVGMKGAQMNQDVADTTNRIREQFNALPAHQQTPGAPSLTEQAMKNVQSATEHTSRFEYLKAGELYRDVSSKQESMKILGRWDADLSTPEIDIDPNATYIDQQFARRAREIDEAYMTTGNYSEALKQADALSRTSLRTDIAIDRAQTAAGHAADLRIEKEVKTATAKFEKALTKADLTAYEAYQALYLNKVKQNTTEGHADPAGDALKWISEAAPFKGDDPVLNWDSFRVYLEGLNPHIQDIEDVDVSETPRSAQLEIDRETFNLEQEQESKDRLALLSQVEGAWKTAFEALNVDTHNELGSFKSMGNMQNFAISLAADNISTYDGAGALKNINTTMSKILQENDPEFLGGWWGIEKPSDVVLGLDPAADPLSQSNRTAMDSVVKYNYSKMKSFPDDNYRSAYINLMTARDALYKLIDDGLLEIGMDEVKKVRTTSTQTGK